MDHNKEQTILENNIRVFSERISLSIRQRDLALEQWINSLFSLKDTDPSVLYTRFCEKLSSDGFLQAEDRANFCARLVKIPAHQKNLSTQTGFYDQESAQSGSHGRIALVRNRYNEEAFSVFEPFVQGAKAEFLSSFSEACEEVFDNVCEFCILPVEDVENGRLFGFYAMLDRYELKICATCTLEHEDSHNSVRYALVGKHLPRHIPKATEWNMEFCLSAESEDFPYDIFRIAPIFQATLIKIDSLPILYDEGAHRIYFTFRIPHTMAYAFDLYLMNEHPRYTPIGLYPILENE